MPTSLVVLPSLNTRSVLFWVVKSLTAAMLGKAALVSVGSITAGVIASGTIVPPLPAITNGPWITLVVCG